MPGQKAQACVVCLLCKATGLFSQEKIRDRMREVFCKTNPFGQSTRKASAETTRAVPALECVTHSRGLASH